MQRRTFVAALATSVSAAAMPAVGAGRDPLVTIAQGRVRGVREAGLSVFRGIRYGQDTAQRRFQAPLAPAPSREIIAATAFAPSCPQRGESNSPTSEDCLFLNIWTPDARTGARRPV